MTATKLTRKTPSASSRPGVRKTSQAGADFVRIAIEYAQAAIADRKGTWTGAWLRKAARRFLADLKRAEKPRCDFRFSRAWATRACEFIELLPHVEDKWDTPNIVLQPAQIFFLVQLFGFRIADGRRFTEALFLVARKNAKSTLAAAILLVCFCLEKCEGPTVVSAATTGQQARIVWGIAKRMIEKTPQLRVTFDLQPFANAIARAEVGGVFRPINAKASTQDGLNPSHVNLDEVHAHKTHDLINVLRSAAGARGNPLWLYTTTEGYENAGPWAEIRRFAQLVLRGEMRADHMLAVIFAIDDKDDDFAEAAWIKANPLIQSNKKLLVEIRKQAINAKAMPGAMAEFQIKRLNRSAATATGYINMVKWGKCAGEVSLDDLRGAPCFGALDLAGGRDMNAWRLLWLFEDYFVTWGRYWVPEEAVAQRTERKSAPYAGWIQGGHIKMVPGATQDYALITREIVEDCARFNPIKIAYDPWNAAAVANDLMDSGLDLVQFRQGAQSYHPALKAMEIAYVSGKLRHGGDPVLRWNAANLVVRYDVNMNMAPDRKRSADKIDGIVSLAMCFGLAEADDSSGFAEFLKNIVSA